MRVSGKYVALISRAAVYGCWNQTGEGALSGTLAVVPLLPIVELNPFGKLTDSVPPGRDGVDRSEEFVSERSIAGSNLKRPRVARVPARNISAIVLA